VAVVAVFESPSLTRERYEESVRRLTDGKGRLESPADWHVDQEIGVEGQPDVYSAHTFVAG
jgi:hypothetical protein